MNERQRMYFRQKLVAWKDEIIRQTRETLRRAARGIRRSTPISPTAPRRRPTARWSCARATASASSSPRSTAALARIEDGSYGYCEETGEPIGLKRLDARPIATLSVEAQERHERRERVYRED